MPTANTISLLYYGGDASDGRLNLYDASKSYEGLARTLAIIGHFYLEQEIIVKAPTSAMPLYLVPPEPGSLKQNIIAGVVGGLIVTGVNVPFTTFATRVIESWVPQPPNAEMQEIIELLKEQNELLRQKMKLPNKPGEKEEAQNEAAEKYIRDNSDKLQAIRSVTSQSFRNIYRPIQTGSARQIGLIGGLGHTPRAVVNDEALGRIEADAVDDEHIIMMAVVNSFSRSSKTGIVFSRDYLSGFRIEYAKEGRLPREDDFSWSQYSGKPVRLSGRFVRFFDGKVKKFLVSHIERVSLQSDIDDYFNNDREVRPL